MKKILAKIAIALFVISIAAGCAAPTDPAPNTGVEIQDIKNNG